MTNRHAEHIRIAFWTGQRNNWAVRLIVIGRAHNMNRANTQARRQLGVPGAVWGPAAHRPLAAEGAVQA